MPITEEHYGALIVRQRPELNRVQIVFPHKPSVETIRQLKRAGFVCSHRKWGVAAEADRGGSTACQNALPIGGTGEFV